MQSFGVKLVYYDRHQKTEIEAMGAEHFSNLEEFVGRCDIVAINVRRPFVTTNRRCSCVQSKGIV